MTDVLLGLGSNVGDRIWNIERAADAIGGLPKTKVLFLSGIYETKPFGNEDQPNFYNAAVICQTDHSSDQFLKKIKELEIQLGRTESERWGPREIDIDLLFFGKDKIESADLKVPHPGFYERDFVLIPVYDLLDENPEFESVFEIERINLDFLQKTVICKIK